MKCTCQELGRHDPNCPWNGKPSGGKYHCIKCGAEPAWEVVEELTTANFESIGGGFDKMTTRYCDQHRPANAARINAGTWRDRPSLL